MRPYIHGVYSGSRNPLEVFGTPRAPPQALAEAPLTVRLEVPLPADFTAQASVLEGDLGMVLRGMPWARILTPLYIMRPYIYTIIYNAPIYIHHYI